LSDVCAGADQPAASTPAAPTPAGGKAREPIRALKLAEAARIRDQQLQAEREAKRRKIKAEMEQRSAARAAAANVKPFDVAFKSKGPGKGAIASRCHPWTVDTIRACLESDDVRVRSPANFPASQDREEDQSRKQPVKQSTSSRSTSSSSQTGLTKV
jgi:hypothetical protein